MAISPVPHGFHSVTPSIVVSPCDEAIIFYEEAFGAEEVGQRMTAPDGTVVHAEIQIGDSVIMMGDEWPDGPTSAPTTLGGSTAALFIYTGNVDELWERALSAGAEVVYPLEIQFYGDKSGRVMDPFGHTWALSQRVEKVSAEEMRQRMADFFV